jgi:ketosteroid isomerase-like protein
MLDDDLRRRRLEIIREHMDTEVTQEFDKTLATFNGHPHYEIMPTGKSFRVPIIAVFFFDGDRIVNERVYFDSASLVTQIGRGELLAMVGDQ